MPTPVKEHICADTSTEAFISAKVVLTPGWHARCWGCIQDGRGRDIVEMPSERVIRPSEDSSQRKKTAAPCCPSAKSSFTPAGKIGVHRSILLSRTFQQTITSAYWTAYGRFGPGRYTIERPKIERCSPAKRKAPSGRQSPAETRVDSQRTTFRPQDLPSRIYSQVEFIRVQVQNSKSKTDNHQVWDKDGPKSNEYVTRRLDQKGTCAQCSPRALHVASYRVFS